MIIKPSWFYWCIWLLWTESVVTNVPLLSSYEMSEHLGTQDFSGVKVLFDQYSLPPPHANLKQLLSSFKLPYLAIQHHAHF